MRRRILLVVAAVGLIALGLGVAAFLKLRDKPGDRLDTKLAGVSVSRVTQAPPPPRRRHPPKRRKPSQRFLPNDRLCWRNFGGDPARSLSRPNLHLGRPTKHFWVRGLHSYIEYPPSYCDGMLYVNTFKGVTYAINAHNGRIVWHKASPGHKPSTPAIAGSRLIVSSTNGTVTAYDRASGRLLWRFRIEAKVESSPVAVDGTVYFGATDGRLFALAVRTGGIHWAYDTGGRINASPSVFGPRVCITTYAGSIFCLRRRDGHKLWSTYVRRDALRYESFYASASTDGRRLYTISRSGKVVALSVRSGKILWTHELSSLGYSTPAIAHGRVFVGDFNGYLHCYRSSSGAELWRHYVGGRILGPAFVVGNLVFFSTLETETYAAKISNGQIVWHLPIGKYSPGIATERHYFFSLNGILVAYQAATPRTLPHARPTARPPRRHAVRRRRGGRGARVASAGTRSPPRARRR